MNPVATRNQTTVTPFATDEDRWAAVVRRDRRADGVFYYSVQTTGIYCRPSCAARIDHRDGLCVEPDRGRHSVPSRRAHRRLVIGVPLGRRAQACATRP